ncbi:hypothetical protein FA13DRAFT_1724649 [Coprinellus micaceus]|jgi:hypothetical protein|uniref:Uncharacterized protein n=1 Tax=Coprinellus micaceus TaxID=71717 RepID=A0A4Y7TY17_COPMI|nr:hypothetical protein FA13DRAFT_1724649 [Coprinellus micaceus]
MALIGVSLTREHILPDPEGRSPPDIEQLPVYSWTRNASEGRTEAARPIESQSEWMYEGYFDPEHTPDKPMVLKTARGWEA